VAKKREGERGLDVVVVDIGVHVMKQWLAARHPGVSAVN
jgi:hypothetical protein